MKIISKIKKKVRPIIKKITPEPWRLQYNNFKALRANIYYGDPSADIIVIGVTGTKGKTSTCHLMWQTLNALGYKTALISTAGFAIGKDFEVNDMHMTMPGNGLIPKYIHKAVDAGCQYCIIETSSEGIKRYRHAGIKYDIAVFTNLSPEHLPSHGGSFDKYRRTKGRLFATLKKQRKTINGKRIPTMSIVNADDDAADYFLSFPADRKITFSIDKDSSYQAHVKSTDITGSDFTVQNIDYHLPLISEYNIYNILPTIALVRELGLAKSRLEEAIAHLQTVPGRAEQIDEGQDFSVLVDYAHESKSFEKIIETGKILLKTPENKIIILWGGVGGGRDKSHRPKMAKLSAELADYVIISDVDPYQDDNEAVVKELVEYTTAAGKILDKNLFGIPDRRQGIAKALSLAKTGDVVLITGKGPEKTMEVKSGPIDWDELAIVRELTREEVKSRSKA